MAAVATVILHKALVQRCSNVPTALCGCAPLRIGQQLVLCCPCDTREAAGYADCSWLFARKLI